MQTLEERKGNRFLALGFRFRYHAALESANAMTSVFPPAPGVRPLAVARPVAHEMAQQPTIQIFSTPDELSRAAARFMASVVNDAIRQNGRAVLGLATGSTPEKTYAELIPLLSAEDLKAGRLVTFNLDEYFPIQGTNNQSYCFYMWNHLFRHLGYDDLGAFVEMANHGGGPVFIPDGSVPENNIAVHCMDYESRIKKMGGIDLQILGIGANGHIGFNEPGSSENSLTRMVPLKPETIAANARFFERESDVPKHAITMGIDTITGARRYLLLATGSGKQEAVYRALVEEPTDRVPASFLQSHPDRLTVFLDRDAVDPRLIDALRRKGISV